MTLTFITLKVPCRALTVCWSYSKLCIHTESSNNSMRKLKHMGERPQLNPRSHLMDPDPVLLETMLFLLHATVSCWTQVFDYMMLPYLHLCCWSLSIASSLGCVLTNTGTWVGSFTTTLLMHLLNTQRLTKFIDTSEWKYWAQQTLLVWVWSLAYFLFLLIICHFCSF